MNIARTPKPGDFISLLENKGFLHWLEIITEHPCCTYYFGPFMTAEEAQLSKSSFLDELLREKAEIIAVNIKQVQPNHLTIFE